MRRACTPTGEGVAAAGGAGGRHDSHRDAVGARLRMEVRALLTNLSSCESSNQAPIGADELRQYLQVRPESGSTEKSIVEDISEQHLETTDNNTEKLG